MAFNPDFAGDTHSAASERRERRRQEDKKRMAYRRAIEDYRESQGGAAGRFYNARRVAFHLTGAAGGPFQTHTL